MAADPNDAQTLVVHAFHGNTELGVAKSGEFEVDETTIKISRGGKTGPSARGTIDRDCRGSVTYYVGPPVAPGVVADLVFTTTKVDTTTEVALTLKNMRAGTFRKTSQDKGLSQWTQEFEHVGDMDDDNPPMSEG